MVKREYKNELIECGVIPGHTYLIPRDSDNRPYGLWIEFYSNGVICSEMNYKHSEL